MQTEQTLEQAIEKTVDDAANIIIDMINLFIDTNKPFASDTSRITLDISVKNVEIIKSAANKIKCSVMEPMRFMNYHWFVYKQDGVCVTVMEVK